MGVDRCDAKKRAIFGARPQICRVRPLPAPALRSGQFPCLFEIIWRFTVGKVKPALGADPDPARLVRQNGFHTMNHGQYPPELVVFTDKQVFITRAHPQPARGIRADAKDKSPARSAGHRQVGAKLPPASAPDRRPACQSKAVPLVSSQTDLAGFVETGPLVSMV